MATLYQLNQIGSVNKLIFLLSQLQSRNLRNYGNDAYGYPFRKSECVSKFSQIRGAIQFSLVAFEMHFPLLSSKAEILQGNLNN
jgi:hypothetical protein